MYVRSLLVVNLWIRDSLLVVGVSPADSALERRVLSSSPTFGIHRPLGILNGCESADSSNLAYFVEVPFQNNGRAPYFRLSWKDFKTPLLLFGIWNVFLTTAETSQKHVPSMNAAACVAWWSHSPLSAVSSLRVGRSTAKTVQRYCGVTAAHRSNLKVTPYSTAKKSKMTMTWQKPNGNYLVPNIRCTILQRTHPASCSRITTE